MTNATIDAPAQLDEAALRRPDFVGGNPITLEDGQRWHFPRPCIEFAPVFGESDDPAVGVATSLGAEFDALVVALDEQPDGGELTGFERIDRMFRLAVWMLRRNYSLTNDDLIRLVRLRMDDEANREAWQAIAETARGTSGKDPGPDTSGS